MSCGRSAAQNTVSVIIPTVGRVDSLRECISSILGQAVTPLELIVVDASSRSGTAEVLAEFGPEAEVRGIGLKRLPASCANASAQKNQGIAQAIGDVVCLLDDDVVLDEGYLREIVMTFANFPDAVGVGGHVKSERLSRPFKRLYQRIFLLNHDQGSGTLQRSGFPAMQLGKAVRHPVGTKLLMGCACYERQATISVGGFDEELGITHLWEDLALPLKLSRSLQLFYNPNARMIHKHSPGGRFPVDIYVACYLYNHYYLFRNHIRPSPLNLACFAWSHLGAMLYMVGLGVLQKAPLSAARGVMLGNLWILKRVFRGWRPDYADVGKGQAKS